MRLKTPLLTVMAAFVLLLASCKNENKSGLFIPKNAALVFHINTSSLSSKLSWDEIKSTSWFKDMHAQASEDSMAVQLLNDPAASGIDTKADFAFFIQRRGKGGYNFFEGSVKDAAALEALIKKISKKDKVDKVGDWSMLNTTDNAVVAWNKSKFAVINNMPELGQMNPMARSSGQTNFSADSLRLFVKEVMEGKGDGSLFDDDRFGDLMKESGDMHFWMNTGSLYSDMAGMMSMMKVGNLLEGNVSAATLNFDDGKITVKSKQYFGKEIQKLMEKFDSKKVDAAVLNRIPSNNIIGVIAASIDPKSLSEFFKAMGLDGLLNMFMAEQNLAMDDIFSSTKGQFIFSISDLQMKDTTYSFPTAPGENPVTYNESKPDMNILFATDVDKKASFDKLLGIVKEKSPTLPFQYQLNNEWFVAGNNSTVVNGFVAGNKSNHAFADKIAGHPFGMYVDLQRILQTKFSADSLTSAMLADAAAVWKDAIAIGGEYKDGASTGEFVVNMVDDKTNSLKQLSSFIEKMNTARKSQRTAFDMPAATDTISTEVIAAPPAVEQPQ